MNPAGTTVAISAYNNATARQNLFNQTDLIVVTQTGRFGHTLLVGTEFGRQDTENFRQTGFFSTLGSNVTTFNAPLSAPTISVPVEFRQSATDADNHGVTTIAAAYAQDQIALSKHVEAVVGLRFDSFKANVTNNRTATDFASTDGLLSPRVGLIYKPIVPLSVYGSYSLTYLPRAGEQLSSLSLTNQALDPEEFTNYELGAKWDLGTALSFTAALYRLDRGNVIVPDPNNPTLSILVDAQRTKGVGARDERSRHSRLEHCGRLRLPGRQHHALDLCDGTGRSDAGAVAETLGFAVEQIRLHTACGGGAGPHLAHRRVYIDG